MNLKSFVKKILAIFDISISRLSKRPLEPRNPFVELGVNKLLDVGANTGQFARGIRACGYKQSIISFEPLSEAHAGLLQNAESDPNWIVAPRVALGSERKKTFINISENSWSSSILEMLPLHSDVAKESIYKSREEVLLSTLDDEFPKYIQKDDVVGIKLDTQGYEKEVLSGSIKSLPQISVVQIELSVVALYLGSEPYHYFMDFFLQNGFSLWSLSPGFSNPISGQLLQFDAVFVRNGVAQKEKSK